MNRILTYLLVFVIHFLFFVQTAFCQYENIDILPNSQVVINPKHNSFLVFTDSTFYYEYKVSGLKWRKIPFYFQGEIPFSQFQNFYFPIVTENGNIYFVDKGVGEVYKLVNDTLRRIDDSFRHQNQFGCTMFTHKNKIYCFGGYGLFTFKNIITCYDEKLSEWFCLDIPCNAPSPEPRADNICRKIGDKLFVLQAACKNETDQLDEMFEKVWEFDLNKKVWTEIGNFECDIDKVFINTTVQHANILSRSDQSLFDFDFEHNILKTFSEIAYRSVEYVLADTTSQYICVIKNPGAFSRNVLVIPSAQFLGKPETTPIYNSAKTPNYQIIVLLVILSFFVLLLIVFVYRHKRRNKVYGNQDNKNGKFWVNNGDYYFNNQVLDVYFGPLEIQLLHQFLNSPNYTLELSSINTIFEFDESGHETIKKRRDACLRSLREKLAKKIFIVPAQVFVESKNPIDKRIKLLKLNPLLLAEN